MDVTRLEGTWRNMAWFARMDHQSQEVLRCVPPPSPWAGGSMLFYLPQLSYSYLTTYTKSVFYYCTVVCTAKVQISKF